MWERASADTQKGPIPVAKTLMISARHKTSTENNNN